MKWRNHILFWLVYCSYFFIQSIAPQDFSEFSSSRTYSNAFVSLCCFIPVCMISVYVSVRFIFPRYIETKKYTYAILTFIALFTGGMMLNYFASATYYSMTGVTAKGPLLLGYLNTIWAMIISGFAVGIKAIRTWDREQKEVHNIMREKSRNDLNLKKRKMHPAFLYSSLGRITQKLESNAADASSMILTLSGLLSYSLYGTDNELIPLENEIEAINDFIVLEDIDRSRLSLRIDPQIDTERLLIPSMTIFSCLQERFLKIRNSELEDCYTEITIKTVQAKVLIQVRFEGLCDEKKSIEPLFIQVPEIYADVRKKMKYDPA